MLVETLQFSRNIKYNNAGRPQAVCLQIVLVYEWCIDALFVSLSRIKCGEMEDIPKAYKEKSGQTAEVLCDILK